MALQIDTFTNRTWRPGNNAGGNTLFKALGHPRAVPLARAALARLKAAGPVAIYDPLGQAGQCDAFHDLAALDPAGVFVQNLADVGKRVLGRAAQPVTALPGTACRAVLVCAFGADRLVAQVRHLLPPGAEVASFDAFRLPDDMLTNARDYLDPLNFVTNFAFLREADDHHTRITTVNYWGTYGARDAAMWLRLFDADGATLAEWTETLPPPGAVFTVDSAEVRRRFGLGPFAGSLFMHAVRVAGHDIMKYAVDTYGPGGPNGSGDGAGGGRGGHLSATHDSNPWPADLYAGLPAPAPGERVRLWIQNSHPVPIPPGAVGLNVMGAQELRTLEREVPPFGCHLLDVAELLPDAAWPDQIEIRAGRHFVRPRYEVEAASGRVRVGHVNVERADLAPDPGIPGLAERMGKGYILPLAVLPLADYHTAILPTPMTTATQELPIAVALYDPDGAEVARRYLGRVSRRGCTAVEVDALLAEAGATLVGGFGHAELMYDFREGGEADGWLHALVRFERRDGSHASETTFGAHIYNTALVYRGEPQSYTTAPPGLTTRLFVRLGDAAHDTLCHLIYPASTPWHPLSATRVTVFSAAGKELVHSDLQIPCGGSRLWRLGALFDADTRRAAAGGYAIVRDTTCRLFGYHGLARADGAFSLDHTFGF